MDSYYIVLMVAAPFVIAGQVYLLVRKMSEPEKMLKPLEGSLSQEQLDTLKRYEDWLVQQGFGYLTSFQFGAVKVVTYQQQNTQRFFSVYFHRKVSFDIESRFDDRTLLETSTSGSAGMFPARPGVYKQSFPGASAEDAWARHLEAEQYATGKFGLQWRPLTMPYEQVMTGSIRLTMQYVRSLPFFPFRALYWFAVSRGRLANRTIQQQFP